MTIGKAKRPTDPNQLVKWVADASTGETEPQFQAKQPSQSVSEYMATIGRKGGQIGGKRRLKTMTKEERKKIAKKAAKSRWKRAKDAH